MSTYWAGTAVDIQDGGPTNLDPGVTKPFLPGNYHFNVEIDEGALPPADHGYASHFDLMKIPALPGTAASTLVRCAAASPGGASKFFEFDLTVGDTLIGGEYEVTIVVTHADGTVASGFTYPGVAPGDEYAVYGASAASRHSNPLPTGFTWNIDDGVVAPEPPPDPGDVGEVVDDDDVFIDTLLETTDKVIRIERLGYGSGSFKVRRDSPDADVIGTGIDGRMVKVTIPRISADPIFRWMIENINVVVADFDEQGGELLTVAGRGALAYLERAKSSPYTYVGGTVGPVEVHQGPAGTGTKPGQILRRIIEESQHVSRPQQPIPLITVDFDYTSDSDGNAWTSVTATDEMNTGYVGESLLVGIEELWGCGEIDILLKPDGSMLLQGFNHYGRDLTGTTFGAGKVRFVKGVNVADRLGRTVGYQLPATHAWVEGDDFVFVDPPAELPGGSAGRPVVETFIRTPGTDPAALEAVGTAHLVEGLRRGESVAFNVAIVKSNDDLDEDAGLYLPGPPGSNGHFWIGDTVTLHTGTGSNDFDNESVRIEAITIWFDEANNLLCKVEVKATTLLGRLPPSTGARSGTGGGSTTPGSAGSSTGGTTQGGPPASSQLQDHITDPTDAHDASAVSYSPTGTISSTDVQAAVAEVSGDVTSHLGDAIDAHDASAISFSPTGTISSTDVQAAIAEVAAEAGSGSSVVEPGPLVIRYTFSSTTTDSDPGSGNLRLSNATQNAAITIRADLADADGADVTNVLGAIANWLSTTKGYAMLMHRTDPTKWLLATISAIATPSGYRNITIANIGGSGSSPFTNGDAIVLSLGPGTLAHGSTHDQGAADALSTPTTPTTQAFGDAASSGAGTKYALDTHKHGMPADPGAVGGTVAFEGLYGNGMDGDATISVNTTINEDRYYHDLTVNDGISLRVECCRIFVSGTLTLTGTATIQHNNTAPGGNGGNGTAAAGGGAGAAGAAPTTGSTQSLPSGTVGRIGQVGGFNANGGNGSASTQSKHGISHSTSASGGDSGTGRTGGTGAASAASTNIVDRPYNFPQIMYLRDVSGAVYAGSTIEGVAPSSGSGAGSPSSGGGGSGGSGGSGGRVIVCARVITGSGNIQANGANGGNGGNGGGTNAGGGAGGSGGAGGIAVLLYKDASGWSGAVQAAGGSGGSGGTGVGSGLSGGTGTNGPTGKAISWKMG